MRPAQCIPLHPSRKEVGQWVRTITVPDISKTRSIFLSVPVFVTMASVETTIGMLGRTIYRTPSGI